MKTPALTVTAAASWVAAVAVWAGITREAHRLTCYQCPTDEAAWWRDHFHRGGNA